MCGDIILFPFSQLIVRIKQTEYKKSAFNILVVHFDMQYTEMSRIQITRLGEPDE